MYKTEQIEAAKEKFGQLLAEQLERVEKMKSQGDFLITNPSIRLLSVYVVETV